jgi:hypothetical protein
MPYETPTPRCRQAKDDERQRTVTYASRGGCACALERAAGLEPSNRHVAHAVGSRDICLRLARSKPLERFRPLISCQLRRPSETHPTGLRTLPSLCPAGVYEKPLAKTAFANPIFMRVSCTRNRVPAVECFESA